MAKLTITEHRIMLFQPMKEGDPYVAIIAGLPHLAFRGATPMAAHKAADTWRKAERAKSLSTKQKEAEGLA